MSAKRANTANQVVRFAALALTLAGGAAGRADPFVEHLAPPALARGKTTRLTVFGSQLANGTDLWTSLPRGAIKAKAVGVGTMKSAVFDVEVAADAPVGVFGLRVATPDGLSNVQLALLDDLPVRPAPPRSTPPPRVLLPIALCGTFEEAQVDRFAIEVTAGQQVSIEVVGNRLGKDVDPLVTIRDADGKWLAERDNDAGLYFDCRFAHRFAKAGTYVVEVCDARHRGNPHGQYVLRMGRFPAARVAVPAAVPRTGVAEVRLPETGDKPLSLKPPDGQTSGAFFAALRRPEDQGSTWVPLAIASGEVIVARETNRTPATAAPAPLPGFLCGVLAKPGERHYCQLKLTAGQAIQVRGDARALNSPADLVLTVSDAAGKELRRATDLNGDEFTHLEFTAPKSAVYHLAVQDLARDGGPAFAYRLEVWTGAHPVQITAEGEGLTVPQGSYQPIPLTVQRGDYSGPLALTLQSAPAGVTLVPTEIPAGVNSIVCHLSATADTPVGVATFQVLAEPLVNWAAVPLRLAVGGLPRPSAHQQHMLRVPVRTRPLIDHQLENVDLIPIALREDQRRLPPALTDRFALQITPPAPFTLELAESLVTLARYQHADFPVVTTRVAGFEGPIRFTARGGQIADKKEGRTRVYTEFEEATPTQLRATGSVHSRILTNLTKHRVDVFGTATFQGRAVTLQRTFDLDIRSAFEVTAEPAQATAKPGETVRVRIQAKRMNTFDGELTVELSSPPALGLPQTVTIPRGQTTVDLELKVPNDLPPGRLAVSLTAKALVDKFEEEYRGGRFEVDVQKPGPPKK